MDFLWTATGGMTATDKNTAAYEKTDGMESQTWVVATAMLNSVEWL
jgi:hypothetical protein